MKVEWNKRVLMRHQQQERLGRVKAKLMGTPVGDIRLGVPVISELELSGLRALYVQMEDVMLRMEEAAEKLNAALGVMRGENHPDVWATIEVIERSKDILVAKVKHHKPQKAPEANGTSSHKKRTFHAGYVARSR